MYSAERSLALYGCNRVVGYESTGWKAKRPDKQLGEVGVVVKAGVQRNVKKALCPIRNQTGRACEPDPLDVLRDGASCFAT